MVDFGNAPSIITSHSLEIYFLSVVSYAKKFMFILGQDAWLLWDHLVPCLT